MTTVTLPSLVVRSPVSLSEVLEQMRFTFNTSDPSRPEKMTKYYETLLILKEHLRTSGVTKNTRSQTANKEDDDCINLRSEVLALLDVITGAFGKVFVDHLITANDLGWCSDIYFAEVLQALVERCLAVFKPRQQDRKTMEFVNSIGWKALFGKRFLQVSTNGQLLEFNPAYTPDNFRQPRPFDVERSSIKTPKDLPTLLDAINRCMFQVPIPKDEDTHELLKLWSKVVENFVLHRQASNESHNKILLSLTILLRRCLDGDIKADQRTQRALLGALVEHYDAELAAFHESDKKIIDQDQVIVDRFAFVRDLYNLLHDHKLLAIAENRWLTNISRVNRSRHDVVEFKREGDLVLDRVQDTLVGRVTNMPKMKGRKKHTDVLVHICTTDMDSTIIKQDERYDVLESFVQWINACRVLLPSGKDKHLEDVLNTFRTWLENLPCSSQRQLQDHWKEFRLFDEKATHDTFEKMQEARTDSSDLCKGINDSKYNDDDNGTRDSKYDDDDNDQTATSSREQLKPGRNQRRAQKLLHSAVLLGGQYLFTEFFSATTTPEFDELIEQEMKANVQVAKVLQSLRMHVNNSYRYSDMRQDLFAEFIRYQHNMIESMKTAKRRRSSEMSITPIAPSSTKKTKIESLTVNTSSSDDNIPLAEPGYNTSVPTAVRQITLMDIIRAGPPSSIRTRVVSGINQTRTQINDSITKKERFLEPHLAELRMLREEESQIDDLLMEIGNCTNSSAI